MKNGYYRWNNALRLNKNVNQVESELKAEFGPNILNVYVRWSEKLQKLGLYR